MFLVDLFIFHYFYLNSPDLISFNKFIQLLETSKNFGSSMKVISSRESLVKQLQERPMSSDKLTNLEKMLKRMNQILDHNKFMTLSSVERKVIQSYILKCELNDELRKQLWLRGSGAKTLMMDNHGYYQRLWSNIAQYPNPWFYQIELDLHRTFSSDEAIYSHTSEEKMRRVLGAYIKRNPTVGYCQGLNFIVAILLNKLEEEEAFWVLCQIIEWLLPIDYYTLMTGVIVDQRWFEQMLKSNMPDVYEHLESQSWKVETYITQWFVWLFANTLDFNMLFQVWDYFFLRGILAIFRVALAIFGYLHDEIMNAHDLGALFVILKSSAKEIKSYGDIAKYLKLYSIPYSKVDNLRKELWSEVYIEHEEQHYK